jgi:hypothetical protein
MPHQPSEIECSICGRDGGPYEGCPAGCNGNPRFIQSRSFTLTEERQGLNPKKDSERYGLAGDVSPKIVVLPGGADPRTSRPAQNDGNKQQG